jgi:DNA topoisomerase-3
MNVPQMSIGCGKFSIKNIKQEENSMSASKLVICEKPSVAQSIAAVLNAKKRQDGFLEGGGYVVSWCFGHLVELASADAYGDRYKRWSRDVLPILPDKWQYATTKDKAKRLSVLRGLMNRADVDTIVCATDAGREGQLIFQLVYNHCKCKKPVQRLWISSMEDSAIRDGFAKLRPGAEYDNLYRSALCRSQADWLVGINATRLYSCLYGTLLSVGRVQSPTLALIVSREAAVRGFVPEPFYTTEINTGSFTASGEKQKGVQAAEVIRAAADERDAAVLSVEKKEKSAVAPKLYDLTTLQREANRLFGYTAQQTLDYTQSLYEHRVVTYPRTDSRYLTSDMAEGLPALIRSVASVLPFAGGPELSIDAKRVVNDSKVSDHHAIIPTQEATRADLTALPAGERNILYMIAVRLICAVAPAHTYEAVTAILECGGYQFTAKGRTTLRDGWKAIDDAFRATLGDKAKDEDDSEDGSALPELKKGQVFPSVPASVREGKTAPPRRYTEDTLLSAMETAGAEDMPDEARRGLGTPATRAATIEKLVKSGFIERQKKALVPLPKGISLIAVLPDSVKSPLLTANWEHRLLEVQAGKLTDVAFLDGIADMTRKLVADHAEPVAEYTALFANTAPERDGGTKRSPIIGSCPRCGSGIIEGPKGFFCSNRACAFALRKDNRFFAAKKKKLTKTVAAALLKEGRVFFSDLYSEKTGKTYGATIVLDDDGGKYVNFRLEFEGRKS